MDSNYCHVLTLRNGKPVYYVVISISNTSVVRLRSFLFTDSLAGIDGNESVGISSASSICEELTFIGSGIKVISSLSGTTWTGIGSFLADLCENKQTSRKF